MNFLAPLFAIGVLGVAIPILVHLVHKERKETTPFPSLMFLLRTPYQHSRRQRIRDWLLFLMRAAVFLLVVGAFARPVFDRAPTAEAAAAAGGRELVILLDHSFSMRVGGRWTRAQDAARQALDGLEASGRGTVILFDDQARVVSEEAGSRASLRAAIDSSRPSDASTRYAPAMQLARRITGESRLPTREVVVISDFQRSGWDLGEEARLPAGVVVTPVDVATGEVSDRAVRAVELRRAVENGRERLTVVARVSNVGPAVRGLEARLEVAGRTVATSRLDLAADAGGVVTFEPQAVPETPQRAAIRIAADDVPEDDVLHFVMERAPSIPVLVVEPGPGVDRDIFLQRALEIGERPAFDITVRRVNQLTGTDFVGKRLVILNDVPFPAGEAGRRLETFVRNGGGLLVAQGEATTTRAWPAGGNGLLPAAPGEMRDRMADKGAVVGFIDRSHPALSLFGATGGVDLSGARFYRYRPIAVDSGVLARFDDGAVALAEQSVGTGRVVTFASSFDGVWNDLPRQLVFLPFVHQIAQYTSGYRAGRNVYEVGDAVDLQMTAASDTAAGLQYVALAPSGSRLRIGGSLGDPALIPAEAGVYEVRRAGAPGERPRLVAVNVPSRELDLARFDPTRLTNAAVAEDASSPAAAGSPPDLATREREQSIWWYLLLVAAALLVAESVLAHRLTRVRASASLGG